MASKPLEALLSINTVGTVILGILNAVLFVKLHNTNKYVNTVEQTCKEISTVKQTCREIRSDLQNIRNSIPTVVYSSDGTGNNDFKPSKSLNRSYSESFLPPLPPSDDHCNIYATNYQETNKSKANNKPCPCPSGARRKIRHSNSMASLPTIYTFSNNFGGGDGSEHSETDIYSMRKIKSDEDLL